MNRHRILVALVILVGAWAVTLPAQAPRDSVGTQSSQLVTFLGVSSLTPASSAPSISESLPIDAAAIQRSIERAIPRTSAVGRAPIQPTLQVPDVKGLRVAGIGRTASGFAGLNHFDQRTANGGNQFSLEPPDQALAVGNGFVVESVNTVLRVFDMKGKPLGGVVDLNTFFDLPPEIVRTPPVRYGPFLSDPKLYFDRPTRRWFLTILEIDVDPVTGDFGTHSATLIAVSRTADPTGQWYLYALDTTDDGSNGTLSHPGCPCLGDQPLIGADAHGFYVSTNEFSIAGPDFNGAQVYALSKAALEAGTPSLSAVHFDNLPLAEGPAYSLQPATSPDGEFEDAAGGTEYFLSALDFTGTLDNRIAVWALTNTRTLDRATPLLALQSQVLASEVYGQPPAADQKAGPIPLGNAAGDPLAQIETNDDRMNQVVFAGGRLFSGVNTVLSVNGTEQAGVAYFVVKPRVERGLDARVARQGYVAVSGNNVIFPSIGADEAGDAVMTFTLVGRDYFPSVAYWPLGGDRVRIAGAGQGPEDGFTGYPSLAGGEGVARWGDYSAAVAAGGRIWFAAEYIPASCPTLSCGSNRTQLANWGTFVGSVVPGE
jgi:hypothetical protein